jgi:predicted dehydrogenase
MHAFRNFLPSLPYAPVELVAVWDADGDRAVAFARQFGAPQARTDLEAVFRLDAPEAVLIAGEGNAGEEPQNSVLLRTALEAGCHAWSDKPPASRAATVRDLIALRDRVGKVAAVGMKTMYAPAHAAMADIVRAPDFGRPTSFAVRYPLQVPCVPDLPFSDVQVRSCLDHIWHPFGAIQRVLGRVAAVGYYPTPQGTGGVALVMLADGTVGSLRCSVGQSGTSPLERFEVVGEGANVVVENAVRLTYYRRGSPGPYGRTATVITDAGQAPLVWEPEMSLGVLYNMNNFFQGYAPSIIAFAEAALGGPPLEYGTLEDAAATLTVFEVLRRGVRDLVPILASP